EAGNFRELEHRGASPSQPGWTRDFEYSEPSLISETVPKASNRLTRTSVDLPAGGTLVEDYSHDPHGNMVRMPHLGAGAGPNLAWDYGDRLLEADRGGG